MDQKRFDSMTANLATGRTRRHAILSAIVGGTGVLGLASDVEAKRRRKKKNKKRRCKRVQAVCRSNKQCCPGKTGGVCDSVAKDAQCLGLDSVCCLPLGSPGCTNNCDCCGGNTGCNDANQCAIIF